MNFILSGKNFEITEALKKMIHKKYSKLSKYFKKDTEAHLTMSVEKNRHILEVTIPLNGVMLRAEVSNDDMYTSIDKSIDKIERQIRKHKTRLSKKLHENAFIPDESYDYDIAEETDFGEIRFKKFPIKPMSLDEAILQMNLLGHEFFMFSNSETQQFNVVYKRKNGNYGVIEPEG